MLSNPVIQADNHLVLKYCKLHYFVVQENVSITNTLFCYLDGSQTSFREEISGEPGNTQDGFSIIYLDKASSVNITSCGFYHVSCPATNGSCIYVGFADQTFFNRTLTIYDCTFHHVEIIIGIRPHELHRLIDALHLEHAVCGKAFIE